jgi:thioglycine synthase
MRGLKPQIELKSRGICHDENGLRAFPLEETLARLEGVLLKTGLELQFERRHAHDNAFFNSSLRLFSPEGPEKDQFFFGKGISKNQSLASAFMEFIERFSSRQQAGDELIKAAYNDVKEDAQNPLDFCLPRGSTYRSDSTIEWVWGYSLSRERPVLVPANLVFFPYEPSSPAKNICWSDSNGLASGNCLEEAILHALLEVVERDAIYIMEFNRLRMPDLSIDALEANRIEELLAKLKAAGIKLSIKIISNDVPIPAIGVFLEGAHEGTPCYSYAAGTHLSPRLALSRALTEAIQLYPRCANYEAWIGSASMDHYCRPGKSRIPFSGLADLSTDDLKTNIETCVDILRGFQAEVIVVDLSLPELPFSMARVCATRLQPYCNIDNQRLSQRMFEVPGRLGFSQSESGIGEFKIRALCGFR